MGRKAGDQRLGDTDLADEERGQRTQSFASPARSGLTTAAAQAARRLSGW